jgi:hypothetical protein
LQQEKDALKKKSDQVCKQNTERRKKEGHDFLGGNIKLLSLASLGSKEISQNYGLGTKIIIHLWLYDPYKVP